MNVIITIVLVAAIAIFLRKMNPKKQSTKRDKTVWKPQPAPTPIPKPTPTPKPEESLMEKPKSRGRKKLK